MSGFKLTSKYKPLGDQPKAIDSLVNGLNDNQRDQSLLDNWIWKNFTIANVIQKVQKPTLILSHNNKTLAAQLYGEFTLFPDNAYTIFYFLL